MQTGRLVWRAGPGGSVPEGHVWGEEGWGLQGGGAVRMFTEHPSCDRQLPPRVPSPGRGCESQEARGGFTPRPRFPVVSFSPRCSPRVRTTPFTPGTLASDPRGPQRLRGRSLPFPQPTAQHRPQREASRPRLLQEMPSLPPADITRPVLTMSTLHLI